MSDLTNMQSVLGAARMEVNGGTPSTAQTVYFTSITGTAATQCYVHTDVNGRWVLYSAAGAFLETGYGSAALSSALHRWRLPSAAVVSTFGGGL